MKHSVTKLSLAKKILIVITSLILISCSNSDPVASVLEQEQEPVVEDDAQCQPISLNGVDAKIELRRIVPSISLNQPITMIQAPDNDERWYVAERQGLIHRFSIDDPARTELGDLSDRVGSSGLEQGLLGIEFHPNYPIVRELFVSYTDVEGNSVISKFELDTDEKLKLDSESIILTQQQPFSNHNGGWIAFGPDGYLYIGFGDGGDGGDPQNNAQNPSNWLGAMLRIDVRQSPYMIPEDNPFSSNTACGLDSPCPEIWAWGLRNPWRWSFDRETGKLWAGDVGQNQWEEISLLEAGKNYGWRCYEGNHDFNLMGCNERASYQFPVAEYSHEEGRSVTGGYVYRGDDIPLLQGQYLYADFLSGNIWGVDVEQQNSSAVRLIDNSGLNIASFAESRQKELFLIDFNGGIYQLRNCKK